MKTKLLLVAMLFGFVLQSWGKEVEKKNQGKQEIKDSIKIIKLNFKTKRFTNTMNELEGLKQGDFYQLQIDSINMNLYKVVLDKKDTIIASKVTFPIFDLANLGGVGELLDKIKIDISNLDGKRNTAENVKNRIDREKSNLLSKDSVISKEKNRIDRLSLLIQKKILSYFVLNNDSSYYRLLSNNLILNDLLLETGNVRKSIAELEEAIRTQRAEYLAYVSDDKVKKIINDDKNKDLKEDDKILQEAFTKTISNVDKLNESVSAEKVVSWLKELVFKENNSSFSYTSLPQQLLGNQVKLNIQIIPTKEESDLPRYQTDIQFPQKRQFYVGAGMSFYYAWFKNEVYSTKATVINDSTTNYQIVDEKNEKGELGLATLIHFGWRPFYTYRRLDVLAVNLVTGPALSLTNPVKPRIAIGGGLAFGRKNMLTLNMLYMGGYVDSKSNIFDTEINYSIKPEKITVSKLQGSFAVSMGYIYKF